MPGPFQQSRHWPGMRRLTDGIWPGDLQRRSCLATEIVTDDVNNIRVVGNRCLWHFMPIVNSFPLITDQLQAMWVTAWLMGRK